MVVYVALLCDVACQKLLNLANVSRRYSQNNTGTVFFETRCRSIRAKRCVFVIKSDLFKDVRE